MSRSLKGIVEEEGYFKKGELVGLKLEMSVGMVMWIESMGYVKVGK